MELAAPYQIAMNLPGWRDFEERVIKKTEIGRAPAKLGAHVRQDQRAP